MALERKGIPTATLITHVFEDYARGLARMQGMKDLPITVIPHPVAARKPEELRDRIRDVHAKIRAALLLDGKLGSDPEFPRTTKGESR